ncbi:MAG: hypothetical protein VW779_09195 [Halieaceae bacterium]
MYQTLRTASACLAFFLGSALIGRLWLVALDAISLSNAAHGLVFLLLALGLIGYQRLSLVLTALACSPALLSNSINDELDIVTIGQCVLFGMCLYLIIIHPRYQRPEEA